MSLGFGTKEPFLNAAWPYHWTRTGRTAGAERFLDAKRTDPNTIFMKAIDESDQVVGMAKWNIYDNAVPDFGKPDGGPRRDYWDNDEEREYAAHMAKEFTKDRRAAIVRTNGNVVSLDIIAVDPKYQRSGVGSALLKWGLGRADEVGVEAVVESTTAGKGLYQKHGYHFIKDVEVQVPERWSGRDKQWYAWLERPKQS